MAIGHLLATGQIKTSRVVSVSGSNADQGRGLLRSAHKACRCCADDMDHLDGDLPSLRISLDWPQEPLLEPQGFADFDG